MCSWSVSRSSNFASFLEDIYIYLASLHFLNDLFPDDNYSNFSWRIDKLSSITFLLYQRLEIFRVLLADLLSWKELEGSEFKQRRPKYPFTKSRNSLRNFEPGMEIFFAFEITTSSIDGTSFSSSYPLFCFRNEETLSADIMLLPVHALWHGGPTLSVSRRTCSKATIGAANKTGGSRILEINHRSIDGNLSSFSALLLRIFFFLGDDTTGLLAKRTNSKRTSWRRRSILFLYLSCQL